MRRGFRLLLLVLFLAPLGGCSNLSYYSQAIGGHLSLLMKRQEIQELEKDPKLSQKLRERLALSQQVVAFARDELDLPDNGSYRQFVKVDGRYVVWNVVAAPRFSLKAKTWCYPIAGCASYRGYYHKQAAEAYADKLRKQGLDVAVAGASAYSTLGWLSDPLLSTMLYRDEGQFAEVIFHELAHQRFYLPGNTPLNESFAEVVATEGVKRWFASRGEQSKYRDYLKDREYEEGFDQLLLTTRSRLEALYDSGVPEAVMARRKQAIFQQLQSEYAAYKTRHHGDGRYDRWMAQGLNNAHLALVATYQGLEPMLRRMLKESGGDMAEFYRRVETYAKQSTSGKTD
jgi:predicted aminopeptidase